MKHVELSFVIRDFYVVCWHMRIEEWMTAPPVASPVPKQQVNKGQSCFLKAELMALNDSLVY